MKKKILALIMCIVMVFGILPVYAFAEADPAQEITNYTTYANLFTPYQQFTGGTQTSYNDFLKWNELVDFNSADKDEMLNRILTVHEVAVFIYRLNCNLSLMRSDVPAFINFLFRNNYITWSQAEMLTAEYDRVKTPDYVWSYNVISEEDKTAELTGVSGGSEYFMDVTLPEEIDGYTIIGTSYKRFDTSGKWEPKSIYVPDTYKRIGQGFCFDEDFLYSVRLPENLEYIGFGSFVGCSNLAGYYSEKYGYEKCMEFDDHGVRYIGTYCFGGGGYNMQALHPDTISVRPGTTIITGEAFNNMDDIRRIIIPEGVHTICQGAFFICDDIKSIVLPTTVTELEEITFYDTYLQAIYIPPTVTKIHPLFIADVYRQHLNDVTVYGVSGSAAEKYANLYDDVYFVDVNDIVYGDVDSDGAVTLSDYATAKSVVADDTIRLDGNAEIVGDMNADQVIDAFDLFKIDRTVNGI
ncbi:MAG: leucine-rich repeat protein [Clostridia bacterium]|nr:leucine-rich repeat protein [Clostridia bacterium]